MKSGEASTSIGVAVHFMSDAVARRALAPGSVAEPTGPSRGVPNRSIGTLGRAELVGRGQRDVVLIPGFGHGGEVFREFIELNGDRYRMLVVTPAGMGGTPAPPMLQPSESYGQTRVVQRV